MPITISHYGRLASGQEVKRFCLTNNSGLTVSIINYGACVISIETPDKDGTFADILLGYDDLAGYEADDKCMGALVGRYCNRIREASFDLDDQTYPLAKNDGENHLHGGLEGFQKRLWEAEIGVNEAGDDVLVMRLFSEDGDQGYPGNLHTEVTYALSDDNSFSINCRATTDKASPVSLTHHGYFNFSGAKTIVDHRLKVEADEFLELYGGDLLELYTAVPIGSVLPVANTPLDFRKSKRLGTDIDESHAQIDAGKGYNHNFIVRGGGKDKAVLAAVVEDDESGRCMEVYSNAPGLQVYTSNYLEGDIGGKGRMFDHRCAICVEPQHFPDAPNLGHFPSAITRPGSPYRHTMIFRFSASKGLI